MKGALPRALFFFFIVYFIADKEISKVRSKFVEKVSKPILKQLLDDLLEDRLLNDGEVESVLEDNTNKADMARCLIDIVRKKGTRGSKMLIDHIKTRDEALHAELFPDSQDQPDVASPTNKTWSNRLIPVSDSERTEKMNDPDIYKVSDKSLKSRVALLITNRNFTDDNLTRKGAEKDEENMLNLLRSLQYEVVKHNDLTAKDIDKALLEFTRHPKLKETDSVFVVIMSHGKRGLILGVDHKIDKPDEFPIDTIYKYLGPNKCSKLMDKPKVIIIQAYCGHTIVSDSVVSDEASHRPASPTGGLVADSFRYVHKEKDFISLLSSTPDTVSYRREDSGSFLIQYIVEVFNTCSHKDDIDELFRKVMQRFEDFPDEKMRQMPTKDRCTLTRRFYLFPGY
uniref:Caspase a n=1 Tax=Xiphophorus couchianus TaxID=32473 RepID=A0A3B5MAD5_9TELE